MGIHLIAAGWTAWEWVEIIFLVSLGLGAVIFVHELGHFLVAKLCGVKCEKFYVGFDIYGYKICKYRWGETEYGIGILPLGGYVKMLGQDDNPARMAKELERSQLPHSHEGGGHEGGGPGSRSGVEPDADTVLDPRSYLAKPVWQRMLIISAGVVMNVIFAFVFAAIAYSLGVKYSPCVVSHVVPGSAAWKVNLQAGDEIVQIADLAGPRFVDLKGTVTLSDVEDGVPVVVERAATGARENLLLMPDIMPGHGLPMIGVSPSFMLMLADDPVEEGSPASRAEPPFQRKDRIIAINGIDIQSYRDLVRVLVQHPDEALSVEVVRTASESEPGESDTDHLISVPPCRWKHVGMVMNYGPISAIQEGAPAELAGLQVGDFLTHIDDEKVADPMFLAELLRGKAVRNENVKLTIQRGSETFEFENVDLRTPTSYVRHPTWGAPVSVPALGIAFPVLNRVDAVSGPAQEAEIVPGDEILEIRFATDANGQSESEMDKLKIEFGEEQNWPLFMNYLQFIAADMQVELSIRRGGKEGEVIEKTLSPVPSEAWFYADRGFRLNYLERVRRADSWEEALGLGFRETKDSLFMVFRFLKKLFTQQISPRLLGGPVTIAKAAGYSAAEGPAKLLIFLTILSANLAVINFLPIPVLDGGHMVLLTLEGVMRRPVPEKIAVALQTAGLVLIISLMVFVLALDFGFIPRRI